MRLCTKEGRGLEESRYFGVSGCVLSKFLREKLQKEDKRRGKERDDYERP